MDTITQALLGASVAEAAFRRRLGGKAVGFGAACGLLPDLDVVSRIAGPWESLVYHRGASHSLVVLPFVAVAIGALATRVWGRREDRFVWMHLAFWALVTHPLLDVFTTYGTQLFAPLSRARFAFDGVAIVDPIYTLPLAVAVFLAVRADRDRSRRVARWALGWGGAYLLLGAVASHYAVGRAAEALRAEGFRPTNVRAVVPIGVPLIRRVVARDEARNIRVGSWSPIAGLSPFVRVDAAPPDPVLSRAMETDEAIIFLWFADGFVSTSRRAEAVVLSDQRYGLFRAPTTSMFTAQVLLNGESVDRVERGERPSIDIFAEIAAGWRRALGR